MDLAKRENGPVGRVVLGPRQILEHHLPGIFQFFLREQRPPEDVGVDRQGIGQLPGDHGSGETGMAHRDSLGPLHAGPLQILDDPPAAAATRTAEHHLAGERRQAAAAWSVMDRTRR